MGADGFTSDPLPLAASHPPIYQRVTGRNFNFGGRIMHGSGFAIDLADGQPDLDRASALLRVEEAKAGLSDGMIPLMAFSFPDLASLADQAHGLIGSKRVFALALDEARLRNELPRGADQRPAPLVYARARIIADARKLDCPVYLKPQWSDDEARNHEIIVHAKADGFDGMIGPPSLAVLIRNA